MGKPLATVKLWLFVELFQTTLASIVANNETVSISSSYVLLHTESVIHPLSSTNLFVASSHISLQFFHDAAKMIILPPIGLSSIHLYPSIFWHLWKALYLLRFEYHYLHKHEIFLRLWKMPVNGVLPKDELGHQPLLSLSAWPSLSSEHELFFFYAT